MAPLTNLIDILEKMHEEHRQLLELAKEKREVLISGDTEMLQSLLSREARFLEAVGVLEREREQFVKDYQTNNGLEGTSYTLDELVGHVHQPFLKNRITAAASKLRNVIQELSQANKDNQQLIQTSLSYLHYSIGLFAGKEQTTGYGPNVKKRYSSLLDAKI
ncbi:flagellar protein FlgN [Bacillus sp. EB01]|uniref:flagellar protein FlgN n=1 Tax=Bacillus sp. EB01 TaxID=1347086 RepID=UPI0005C734D8|nr:flagellar protein FlgN [Bacillus sp. EB01]